MRQSRRANIGHKRNTIARRWRPWVDDQTVYPAEDAPVAPDAPSPAESAALGQYDLALGEQTPTTHPE